MSKSKLSLRKGRKYLIKYTEGYDYNRYSGEATLVSGKVADRIDDLDVYAFLIEQGGETKTVFFAREDIVREI